MIVIFEFQDVCSWKEYHQSQGSRHMADQCVYFICLVPSTHCSKSLVSDKAPHQKFSVIYMKFFTGTKVDSKRDSSERVNNAYCMLASRLVLHYHLHTGTISTLAFL